MIPRSRLIAILALLVALATHAAAMLDFGEKPETKIKGGGDVGVAALGNSFRNMTAGTIPPETPEITETSKPEPIQQPEPHTQQTALPAPSTARAPEPVKPAQSAPPQQQMAALAPAPMAALTPATSPQAPTPPKLKTQPPKPQQKASVAPAKLKPTDQKKTPVKPIKDEPKPKPKKTKKKQAAAPKGNSAKTERLGQANGKTKSKKSTASASGRKAAQQGNAAASNYRGIVFRKIERARRRSTEIRGTVVVSLQIANSGSLAHVSISRSSGSARLDKIALSQVRRAAPFPRPPAGVTRAYAINLSYNK